MNLKKTKLNLKLSRKRLIVVVFIFIFLLPIAFLAQAGYRLYQNSQQVKRSADQLKSSLNQENVNLINNNLIQLNRNIQKADKSYQPFLIFSHCPLIGNYFQDGYKLIEGGEKITRSAIILTSSLKKQADLLGLKGEHSSTGGTIQERMVILSQSLNNQLNDIQEAVTLFNQGSQLILSINPERYQRFPKLKEKISNNQVKLNKADQLIQLLPETIKTLPTFLGTNKETNYLVLLQNDAELRPTGGFITAYARLKVKRGVITNSYSQDIYSLDRRFRSHIPAPKPIKEYLVSIPYWYLRDMNLSPDFKKSMETFYPNYLKVGQPADIIVAIDTRVVTNLMKILGDINLPGYGNFTTRPDPTYHCPQVIAKLEKIIDQPRGTIVDNRKSILSPLMAALIDKILTAPKNKWPFLFKTLYRLGLEKDILIYSPNETIEKVAQDWNFAGRVKNFKGDYLLVVDANMGGAKSNLYINEEVKQTYSRDSQNNRIIKKVTITYRNPQPWSNCNLEKGGLCLNGEYRDWLRLYVPKGSKLIKVTNSLTKPLSYDELGKTVFEGYIKLRPPGFYRITFSYSLPFSWQEWQANNYPLLIQKQAGVKPIRESIVYQKEEKLKFNLNQDTIIKNFQLNK